ncbi:Zinc finger C2H2-type [Trinorchestia longiramus]|nr:Zinc finger C2H2-type [Trinorchestia longiramus]
MPSGDLSCLFCKPEKSFSTWVDLKTHLEQHVIEASTKRSCNNCSSTCCGDTSSSSTMVPVKRTEDVRKIVGLVRPVIHQSSCCQIDLPSTSCTSAAGDAATDTTSSIPQQQNELSSVLINVKKKWMPPKNTNTNGSVPLLLVAAPQVERKSSQMHAPQRILSVLPIEKRISSNSGTEDLPSAIKMSFIEGEENTFAVQDVSVLHATPFTKFSIVHSKAAVETFEGSVSYIKVPASVVGQDVTANTATLSQEESTDVSCFVGGNASLPNFSIISQVPEHNTPSDNHVDVAVSGSSNLSCTSLLSQGSTILVENPSNENQETICNPSTVVPPTQNITSTNLRTSTYSPHTKVFHVMGNTATVGNTASVNKIDLSSSYSPNMGTLMVENPTSVSTTSSQEKVSSSHSVASQKFDDTPKYSNVSSHFSLEPISVTSASEVLSSSSSSSSSVASSNICNVNAPESSSSSLCTLERLGSRHTLNDKHNLSGSVTSEIEEEQVDDPLYNDTENRTSLEVVGLQTTVAKKINQKCFACKKCDATFSSRRAALAHQAQTHGKPRAFECHECGRSFASSHNLSTHRKHRHASNSCKHQPTLCTVCGKSFASKSNLVLHARLHSGERPFVCTVCNKSFSRKCTLEKHSLYHRGERRYTCERSFVCDVCDAKYVVMSDLKRHKLSHAPVKPFPCDLCSKTFSRKHDLNVHALYHARSSRFRCEFCERQFVEESNYKRHLRQHTGEKPYLCNACGVRYSQVSARVLETVGLTHGVSERPCDSYSQLHHVKKHLQTCHRDALQSSTAVGSVAAHLYRGAYSVPQSMSRNRKGYLEKISAATRLH